MESYYNRNAGNRNSCRKQANYDYMYKGAQCQNHNQRKIYDDGHGRQIEVECVCKASSTVHCHKKDGMDHLNDEFPIAMAYVRWQQWGDLYEPECALCQGTIFKDLNKIFCGERC